MFSEKLRSLLRFGPISTRYKDIFDMYFLKDKINMEKLKICLDSYIYSDPKMHEKNGSDIVRRLNIAFKNKMYLKYLNTTDKKWLDEDLDIILNELLKFAETFK